MNDPTAGEGREPGAPLLSVRGVTKHFGVVAALVDVALDFRAGEIHALLGENGAGKSTLMHVLSGGQRPDRGTITLDGLPVTFASPRAARAAGIGMVHQHFTLVEPLRVVDNLALALPQSSRWRFDPAAAAAQATVLAKRVGLALGPTDLPVSQLPVGARQRLEILKALAGAGRVLILDEPTAVLTPDEVRQLFIMLRQLRAQNRAIIFITHKLREVREIADRVTIMRRGRVIGTYPVEGLTEAGMAERMIGAPPPARHGARAASATGPLALRVVQLVVQDERRGLSLADVSFAVRAGEIFGIAGVDGNGQRELFEVLAGMRQPRAGTVEVFGQPLEDFTPAAIRAAGVGHIPPDRQREGLVLSMTVAENFLLARGLLDRVSRYGVLSRRAARRLASGLAARYGLRFASLDAPVRSLSGGNQQRVVVARALAQEPRVLVTVNPTRGLDVAAARAVADALRDLAAAGSAIVLISTDLDEVLELSDRLSVLARGRLSESLRPPVEPERLGLLMAGAEGEVHAD